MIVRLVLFVVLTTPIFGQPVSVGIAAGVPITKPVKAAGDIGGVPFRTGLRRFTIGPVLDIHLPFGLGIELAAMYKRFDQHAGQVQVIAEPGRPYTVQSSAYSRAGGSWDFPILGQYRLPGTAVRLYLEAGLSFNRLNGLFTPFRTLVSQSAILTPGSMAENRRGTVAGAGIKIKVPFMSIAPGLQYTRYGGTKWFWLPSADALDFLVGFKF